MTDISGLDEKKVAPSLKEIIDKPDHYWTSIEKKPFENLKENVYFITCKNSELFYLIE